MGLLGRHAGAVAAWLSLAGTLAACGDPAERTPPQRLIEESPPRVFDEQLIGVREPLFSWSLADESELPRWEIVDAAFARVPEAGILELEASTNDLRLTRTVDLAAAAVEGIQVRFAQPLAGPVKVYWAGPDDEMSEQRSMSTSTIQRTPGRDEWVASLRLRDHHRWAGTVRSLRLDPTNQPGARVRIRSVVGIGSVPSAQRELAASGQVYSVGLGDDFRPAVISAAGTTREWRVSAAGGTLEVGYAVVCVNGSEPGSTSRFEVRREPDSGARAESTLLFEAEISPSGGTGLEHWGEAVVDLPATTAGELELSLGFDAAEGVGSGCVGAWANPIVVEAEPAGRAPDVLLISLDTVRSDRLGPGARSPELSPRIDDWARRRAVAFPNTIAAAPWTLPSHATMLTGLDPISHGVYSTRRVPAEITLLAERLRDAGYETVAFTGGAYLDPAFGLDQGFERYVSARGATSPPGELESHVQALLDLLERPQRRPRFVFLHTYEPHTPYRGREPYFSRLHPGVARRERDPARLEGAVSTGPVGLELSWTNAHPPPSAGLAELANALYDSGIAYTDDLIGRILDALDESGRADGTIVVLTSDHGEALGEDGRVGHGHLSDDNLVVPLIIAAPGRRTGLVHDERVHLADIVPTLLDLLEMPHQGLDGSSLVSFLEGGTRAVQTTWSYSRRRGVSVRLPGDVEYVMNPTPWVPNRGREELYRIGSGRPEARIGPAPPAGIAALRRLVIERLLEMPGYWMRFQNRTDTSLSGNLRFGGAGFVQFEVEAPGACPCLAWVGDDRIVFNVPEGESYTLLLAPDDARELRVNGTFGSEEFDFVVPARTLEGTVSVVLGDGAPALQEGGLAAPAGFSFWMTRPRQPIGDASEMDPAVAERLRALGYVR